MQVGALFALGRFSSDLPWKWVDVDKYVGEDVGDLVVEVQYPEDTSALHMIRIMENAQCHISSDPAASTISVGESQTTSRRLFTGVRSTGACEPTGSIRPRPWRLG